MTNEKGGLIKKKKKPSIMQPAVPVKKTQASDFSYSTASVEQETPHPIEKKVERKKPLTIGKQNSTKSLKVPSIVHTELNLLGSFMDESKTYVILQKLIDSYIRNELSNRQQRQFEFMLDAFSEEKPQK